MALCQQDNMLRTAYLKMPLPCAKSELIRNNVAFSLKTSRDLLILDVEGDLGTAVLSDVRHFKDDVVSCRTSAYIFIHP